MSSASKIIQAAAGNAAGEALGVEDVFSTYLYTGNGSTQTITNGIDLDGEGGLVWIKNRDATDSHILTDTERGATEILSSDSTAAEATDADTLTAFNSDGFAIGADVKVNTNTEDYASWTFRKAPKFFDVVTYTGDGVAGREIAHNLGSVPGMIIIKCLSNADNWYVYHRGVALPNGLFLNSTIAAEDMSTRMATAPTSSIFTVETDAMVNFSGRTYVAYLFAHNNGDGEFGESGDQDIIKCGSYTGTGSSLDVSLGFEPQWILVKRTDSTSPWTMWDVMRGLANNGTSDDRRLKADTSDAESNSPYGHPTATGFTVTGTNTDYNASGGTYIYIAIRRGPMKTPESGTEVFAMDINSSTNATPIFTAPFPPDFVFAGKDSGTDKWYVSSRLTGDGKLNFNSTAAEVNSAGYSLYFDGAYSNAFNSYSGWMFRRAPGFFDVVAYEGTGSATTISHNLGVVPELIIVKNRDQADAWQVYAGDETDYLVLNTNAATADNVNRWNDTAPTASVFTIGTAAEVNTNTEDYIAYLFATLDGISKVFSVTKSSGSDATVDCGFSAGARFVLLKRTDSTGDWYVWDTERGIVAGDDPYLLLNSTAAEVTNTDYIDPDSSGFVIVDNGLADGDYIGLAIA